MPDEHKPGEADKPVPPKAADRPLNETEQMHKAALDQINQFKQANKLEREQRLAAAKKDAEEIAARAAAKNQPVEKKHAALPPEDETEETVS